MAETAEVTTQPAPPKKGKLRLVIVGVVVLFVGGAGFLAIHYLGASKTARSEDLRPTAWLDAYHARVRSELSPLLDAETSAWLARATAPLG